MLLSKSNETSFPRKHLTLRDSAGTLVAASPPAASALRVVLSPRLRCAGTFGRWLLHAQLQHRVALCPGLRISPGERTPMKGLRISPGERTPMKGLTRTDILPIRCRRIQDYCGAEPVVSLAAESFETWFGKSFTWSDAVLASTPTAGWMLRTMTTRMR
jgi:hypothetical protein